MDLSAKKQQSWFSKLRKDPPAILRPKIFQKNPVSTFPNPNTLPSPNRHKDISKPPPSQDKEHIKDLSLEYSPGNKHQKVNLVETPTDTTCERPTEKLPVKRKRTPEGHIKRPMNAFMVWSKVERHRIISLHPAGHHSEISKLLGVRWSRLSPADRQPFVIEADRLRQVHFEKYPDYKYKPKRKTKVKNDSLHKNKLKYIQSKQHSKEKKGNGCPNVNMFETDTIHVKRKKPSISVSKKTLSALSKAQMQAGVEIFKPMPQKSNSMKNHFQKPSISDKVNETSTDICKNVTPLNSMAENSEKFSTLKSNKKFDALNLPLIENTDSSSSSSIWSAYSFNSTTDETFPNVKIDVSDTPEFFCKFIDIMSTDTSKVICAKSYQSGERSCETFNLLVDAMKLNKETITSDIKSSAEEYKKLKNMQLDINYSAGNLPDLAEVLGKSWNDETCEFID